MIKEKGEASLCERTLADAATAYPGSEGAVIHSGWGAPHASAAYRKAISRYNIRKILQLAIAICKCRLPDSIATIMPSPPRSAPNRWTGGRISI